MATTVNTLETNTEVFKGDRVVADGVERSLGDVTTTGLVSSTNPFGDGSDTALADRSNILLNSAVPTWTVPPLAPSGTTENPTWVGWFFNVAAGDVLTCTGRCPAQWVAPV